MKQNAEVGMRNAELQSQPSVPPKEALPNVRAPKPALDPVSPQSAIRNPQSIELHIEELVIHGFAPDNHGRFAAAVESELTRLLSERGIGQSLSESMEIEQLHGGAFRVRQDEQSEGVGQHLAKAIYLGVTGGQSR